MIARTPFLCAETIDMEAEGIDMMTEAEEIIGTTDMVEEEEVPDGRRRREGRVVICPSTE